MQAARGWLIRVVRKIPLAVDGSTITENVGVLRLNIPSVPRVVGIPTTSKEIERRFQEMEPRRVHALRDLIHIHSNPAVACIPFLTVVSRPSVSASSGGIQRSWSVGV